MFIGNFVRFIKIILQHLGQLRLLGGGALGTAVINNWGCARHQCSRKLTFDNTLDAE